MTPIRAVQDLIHLDMDAIKAYEQAIKACDHDNVAAQLRSFQGDHQRHVNDLSEELRKLGEQPDVRPEQADSFPQEWHSIPRRLDAQRRPFRGHGKGDEMNRNLMMAVLGCAGICACAPLARESRQAPIELLDAKGVSAPALSIESGGALSFVNGDAKPHQIYSPDCPELASTALRPGQVYTVTVSPGPKVCHFQDLLAPLAPAYSGTVDVLKPPHNLADDFTGTE